MMLLGACGTGAAGTPVTTFVVASTTSTQDSGFLDALAPRFEDDHPDLRMKVLAVGSGEALELGTNGDADVLLVHSPADEEGFMERGHGVTRKPVMRNDFVIAGPSGDPAAIASAQDAVDAFTRIATTNSTFVSRGDASGTHKKELEVWETAGISPSGDWYLSSGQGMAETLTIASERRAYVLTDTATLKATKSLTLPSLFEGDPTLVNPYTVIVVKGARRMKAAVAFSDWITGEPGRAFIQEFGRDEHGSPLFQVSSG